jgi:hypothetical protein
MLIDRVRHLAGFVTFERLPACSTGRDDSGSAATRA